MNLKDLEHQPTGFRTDLDGFIDALRWNDEGLIPSIAQQYDSGEVLMMAWMNRESLRDTLLHKRVCYWSRSRRKLWRKGEESGQVQNLVEARSDCDGDTLLLIVDQTGPACHTGRANCFFWKFEDKDVVLDRDPIVNPDDLYGHR